MSVEETWPAAGVQCPMCHYSLRASDADDPRAPRCPMCRVQLAARERDGLVIMAINSGSYLADPDGTVAVGRKPWSGPVLQTVPWQPGAAGWHPIIRRELQGRRLIVVVTADGSVHPWTEGAEPAPSRTAAAAAADLRAIVSALRWEGGREWRAGTAFEAVEHGGVLQVSHAMPLVSLLDGRDLVGLGVRRQQLEDAAADAPLDPDAIRITTGVRKATGAVVDEATLRDLAAVWEAQSLIIENADMPWQAGPTGARMRYTVQDDEL